MYIALLALLIFLLAITIIAFEEEILAPPVVMLLMFILAGFFGLAKWNEWKLNEYSGQAVFILMSGIVAFVVSSYFVRILFPMRSSDVVLMPLYHGERIEIGRVFLCIFILTGVACNIALYQTMRRIVGGLGFSVSSISAIINHFRNITTFEVFAGQYSIPMYVKMLIWITTSIGIFALFVFFHNLIFRVYKKRDTLLIIIIILWLTAMLLNSHRSYILTALSIVIYLVYFFQSMYYGWKPSISRKILSIGIKLFVVLLIGFVALAVLLGRTSSFSDINIINYFANYISSGIRNFDLFILNPPAERSFGGETFASLYRSINNLFNLGNFVPTELEFTYIDGQIVTNIYTAFRRYYSDFGYWGMILISALMGGLFTQGYECIKRRGKGGKIDFHLLFFLYFCKGIFQMCIEETILDFEVSLNGVFKIFVLYALYYVFVKKRIRITAS